MSEFGPTLGMHSYADQAGFYPPDHPREHNATEVGRIVARYIADTTNFQRGNALVRSEMKATERTGKRAGASAASYGKYIALAGGAAIIGSLKSFADYQRNLNIFQANTDASKKTMAEAGAVAKKLGADLRFPGVTAGDVAETLVELSKAGLNAKQSIKTVDSVLLLGTAGQMDYAEAGAIAANAMNAFHLKAKDVPRLVDDIAGAALKSSSNVEDVATAFRYVSATGSKMGVPVKMMTTLVGMLSNIGLKGDMAGTSLRMFMASIAHIRSNPAADLMRKVGLLEGGKKGTRAGKNLFFDEKGNVKSFDKIAQLYKTHVIDKLTKKQRMEFDNVVFGVRGQNTTAIFDKGAAGINKFLKASTKAGSANKLAAANTKGLYGAYQALVNTVQTLGLELGEVLAPTVINILHRLNGLAGTIQRNKTVVKAMAAVIIGATAAWVAWRAILVVWRAAMIVNNAIIMVGKGIMIAYRAAVLAIRAPIVIAMAAQWLFNAAVSANPLGLFLLAVVAVILILRHYGVSLHKVMAIAKMVFGKMIYFVTHWRQMISIALSWVKKHWAIVVLGLLAPWALLILLIIKKWHVLTKFLQHDLWPLIKKGLKAALDLAVAMIKRFGKWFYGAGVALGKALADGIKDAAVDGVKSLPGHIWGAIKSIKRNPLNALRYTGPAGYVVGKAADQMGGGGGGAHGGGSRQSGARRGGRAMGGTVWGRGSYLVGERGPEIFTPGVGGHITPHGMGGPSVNIEHMSVRSEEDPYVVASILGRQMRLAQ